MKAGLSVRFLSRKCRSWLEEAVGKLASRCASHEGRRHAHGELLSEALALLLRADGRPAPPAVFCCPRPRPRLARRLLSSQSSSAIPCSARVLPPPVQSCERASNSPASSASCQRSVAAGPARAVLLCCEAGRASLNHSFTHAHRDRPTECSRSAPSDTALEAQIVVALARSGMFFTAQSRRPFARPHPKHCSPVLLWGVHFSTQSSALHNSESCFFLRQALLSALLISFCTCSSWYKPQPCSRARAAAGVLTSSCAQLTCRLATYSAVYLRLRDRCIVITREMHSYAMLTCARQSLLAFCVTRAASTTPGRAATSSISLVERHHPLCENSHLAPPLYLSCSGPHAILFRRRFCPEKPSTSTRSYQSYPLPVSATGHHQELPPDS